MSSPEAADPLPRLSLPSGLQVIDTPEKDCENSSSTQADSDSLSSLDLPPFDSDHRSYRPRTQEEIRLKYFQKL